MDLNTAVPFIVRYGFLIILTFFSRQMFPQMKFKMTGLDPKAKYILLLDIVAAKHPETKFIKSVATKCVENF